MVITYCFTFRFHFSGVRTDHYYIDRNKKKPCVSWNSWFYDNLLSWLDLSAYVSNAL